MYLRELLEQIILIAINFSYFLHEICINFFVALLVLKLKQLGFSFSIWPGVNTQLGNYAIILREFIRLQENCETNGYFHKTDYRLLWNL